jgi:hypothetical protein
LMFLNTGIGSVRRTRKILKTIQEAHQAKFKGNRRYPTIFDRRVCAQKEGCQ